jgi:hypothetical protein
MAARLCDDPTMFIFGECRLPVQLALIAAAVAFAEHDTPVHIDEAGTVRLLIVASAAITPLVSAKISLPKSTSVAFSHPSQGPLLLAYVETEIVVNGCWCIPETRTGLTAAIANKAIPPALSSMEWPLRTYVTLDKGDTLHCANRLDSPIVNPFSPSSGISCNHSECSTERVIRVEVMLISSAATSVTTVAGVKPLASGLAKESTCNRRGWMKRRAEKAQQPKTMRYRRMFTKPFRIREYLSRKRLIGGN